MQISRNAYICVETLVRLAVQNADKPCSTKSLAEWINCSVSYTETLTAKLRKSGLLVSRQGPGGGHTLARPADQITVAEVFEAVDVSSAFANHPLNAETLEDEDSRNLHGTDLLWEALQSYVLLFLNGVSLADLALEAANSVGEKPKASNSIYLANTGSTLRH